MKNIKALSFFMALIMMIASLSFSVTAETTAEKESRTVYLHAFNETPLLTNTSDRTTVYMGDKVNVALALDKPNKAENDNEPQFNIGGFTVKIYFDTRYFKFDDSGAKVPGIEYYFVADNGWADDDIENGTGDQVGSDAGSSGSDAAFDKPGFVKYSHGTHIKDGHTDSSQGYAYATIFYSGKSLPYGSANKNYWYDIARLPLIPRQTGNTSVQVDISGDDEYTLELFAKDHPDLDEIKRSFDYTALNSGVFNITIADKSKPNPPVATPVGSTYTSAQRVKLSVENPDDLPAKIFYTTDGSEPTDHQTGNCEEYTPEADSAGILIDKSTTLKCITVREKDGRSSNTATYIYTIVPRAPILFNEHHEVISNSYTENWAYTENWDEDGYKVYASDKDKFDDHITDGTTIYYTFTDLSDAVIDDNPSNVFVGTNPETQWVKVSSDTKELSHAITKFRTVRLVNVFKEEHSTVSTYYLGIKPGAVFASPAPNSAGEAPVNIDLTCYAPPEAKIYYTINGKNPKLYGSLYDGSITLSKDTTIKAVAFYEDIWGEVCTFDYTFPNNETETVIAYNPPGNYEGITRVNLMPAEPGKKIFYSLDGGEFEEYTSALSLDKDTVVTAYVEGDEDNKIEFEYKIKPLPPVFSPSATQLGQAEWVTIFTPGCSYSTRGDYELKFTVDGSTPDKNTVNPTGIYYKYNPETHEARVYVTDKTLIKAVVVKYGEYVSDVVSHKYEVITNRPAAPVATLPEGDYSTSNNADLATQFKKNEGVEVYYTLATGGNAVADPDPNNPDHLYSYGSDIPLKSDSETVIKAIAVKRNADGSLLLSDVVVLRYRVENEDEEEKGDVYADKPSGTYIESKEPFRVSLGGSGDIWYNKNGEGWKKYTDPVVFDYSKADVTLHIRNGETGEPAVYSYHFDPPAPVITPMSGVYKGYVNVKITYPEGDNYRYMYQVSGDDEERIWQQGNMLDDKAIQTKSYEAYVINTDTKVMSKHVYGDYIVTDSEYLGELSINWPYNAKRIAKHLLSTDDYIKGITFGGTYGNSKVIYQVKYTPNGGNETPYSPQIVYDDKLPFIPTKQMENVTIKAWIEGKMDDAIEHTIEFIDLGIPTVSTNREKNSSGNYPRSTKAVVESVYSDASDIVVFYTTNGENATKKKSQREYFSSATQSEDIVLSKTTTIRAAYYLACGASTCVECSQNMPHKCKNGMYGDEFNSIFPVVQPSGGVATGGGFSGGTSNGVTERKYTKDIFGNEHPTHIGYINGYPDGSVKPDGHITREEIAAILYRITNHDYEKPFIKTGEVFPDVSIDRWSAHDIEYMAERNVILGYPDGTFIPAGKLTRAEFAALIFRFAGLEYADTENTLSDIDDSHWAYREVVSLAENGLVEGYEDGTFRPQNTITRAEVMTVINRLLGRKPLESYVKSLSFNPYNDLIQEKWYYVTVLEATITHNYWLDKSGYEYKWEDWK